MTEPAVLGAVIGSPITHSLSPAMYRAAFAARGLAGTYVARECDRDTLAVVLSGLVMGGARGISVTMPLKEAVIAHLDRLDATAALLGAVNCIAVTDDGMVGHNTDGDGCCDALALRGGAVYEGRTAVVLGAGGTGRSVALALGARGCEVVVVNRTAARTDELIDRLGDPIRDAGGRLRAGTFDDIASASVLVNTTSVGMGSMDSPLPPGVFGSDLVVLDAVYQPLETRLLTDARTAGARVVDGLWMLVHQAVRQCVLQFGWEPDPGDLRLAAERELSTR